MSDPSQDKADDQPQENEFEELDALLAEPTAVETRQTKINEASSDDEFDDLGGLIKGSGYQGLPGSPSTAISGKKYICPVPNCTRVWFRQGLRTPPLCEDHGVVMIPVPDEG
jgi:hypothetical protein